jgi:Tfp pilus assembly protein PilV
MIMLRLFSLRRTIRVQQRRDGFALPLAIVVLALLTMSLVAGFAMTTSEMSTAASQRAEARAYSNAQRGLEAFLSRRKENAGGVMFCPHCWAVNATAAAGSVAANIDGLPTQRETVTVAFPGGMAIVRATPVLVNAATGRGKYFITSTGYDSTSGIGGLAGRSSMASRTVGVFSSWNTTTVNVLSAWTSLTGIVKNGTGTISGVDQCGGPDKAGLSVPQYNGTADLTVNSGWAPTGSPPYDTTKTFAQESASVKIDWATVKSGSAIPADIVIGAGSFPSVGTFAADTNYWPVIHVTNGASGAYALPNQGRGMLIVDGDLTISGSNQWFGVILVGGVLTSNGNNVSEGATMSGLNALTGVKPSSSSADDAEANGQKSYVYDSCSVSKATSTLARYTMMPNTWMDNLPGY